MSYLPKSNGYNLSVGVPIDKRMKIDYRERITIETIADPSRFLLDTSAIARWEFMKVDVKDARTRAEREATGINAVSAYSACFKLVGGTGNNHWVMVEKNGEVIHYAKQLRYFEFPVSPAHGIWSGSAANVMNIPSGTRIHSVALYGPGIEGAISAPVAGSVKVEDASQRIVFESPSFTDLAIAPLHKIIDTANGIDTAHKVLHFPINANMDQSVLITITGDLSALTKEAIIKIVYEI